MRESIHAKAVRYLAEGRVRVLVCNEDSGVITADVRGLGSSYTTGRDNQGWFCDCQAHRECAHIVALKLITALEPRRP